jgi:hypothetical protein
MKPMLLAGLLIPGILVATAWKQCRQTNPPPHVRPTPEVEDPLAQLFSLGTTYPGVPDRAAQREALEKLTLLRARRASAPPSETIPAGNLTLVEGTTIIQIEVEDESSNGGTPVSHHDLRGGKKRP